MMNFSKLDSVIRRQRNQMLSMLVTFAFAIGGAVVAASTLSACTAESDQGIEAVEGTLAAAGQGDLDAAAGWLAPGFARASLQPLRAVRYAIEDTELRDGGERWSTLVDDGTPLPARIVIATRHDREGRISAFRIVAPR